MKALSIHNLDDRISFLLRKKAKESGMSLNKTIQSLLKNALGLEQVNKGDHRGEFRSLFGVWTRQDTEEFDRATRSFKTIDKEDWR